jgi:hypothetical protein
MDIKERSKAYTTGRRSSLFSGVRRKVEPDALEEKIDKLFSGQDLLFERLHTEPKWQRTKKAYEKGVHHVSKSALYVKKQPVLVKMIVVAVLSIGSGGAYYVSQGRSPEKPVSEVAGITSQDNTDSIGGLPKEKPSFELLFPVGKGSDDFDIARVSPEGSAPAYAYVDILDDYKINVSMQELPQTFDYNKEVELERVAKGFQATDVIQIDSTKIYHGVSDKTKEQFLLFIKNDRLVFVRSPQKLPDDTWAGYIVGFNN